VVVTLKFCPFCLRKKGKGIIERIIMTKSYKRYIPDEGEFRYDVFQYKCPNCDYTEYFSEEEEKL
tara:strand:- start:1234 stop:1428 length:195 start_codon:yes stop_codon:yes gene_type:complete